MHKWLAALAWLPAGAAAFQPLITDDTGTQGAGGNQIEAAYGRSTEKEPDSRTTTTSVPVVYTRGWTDALDVYLGGSRVRFSPPPANGSTNHGAGNIVAGLKWRFYEDDKAGLSLAFKPEIRLPVSDRAEDRGLGNGKTNGGATWILTQETGFGAIHANLAVNSQRYERTANRDANRDTLWRLSVAPVFDLNEEWKIAFDAGLVNNPHRTEKSRMGYVEAGAIYSPNKDLDFALGVIRDVSHPRHQVRQFTTGVTWRFR